MKITIFSITLLLISATLFAQDIKRCLFIGLYDGSKNWICSQREVVYEEIEDYFDYTQKSNAFYAQHKSQNANTRYIGANECAIVYKCEKEVSGRDCTTVIIMIKTGKTLEDCEKQMTDYCTKYPKDFITQPKAVFTWKAKGKNATEYTKDFGGVTGKFLSVQNNANRDYIVAKFSNSLKDKTAVILLQTDAGMIPPEYLKPGATLTKSYDTKNLTIQIIYQDYQAPPPSFDVIDFVKGKVRETVTNDNGKIKPILSKIAVFGVRG